MPSPSPRKVRTFILVAALAAIASLAGVLPLARERWEHTDRPADLEGDDPTTGALRWLARHQQPDGRWSADLAAVCSACRDEGRQESDVRLTSLAVLAYLTAGQTPQHRASYLDPVTGRVMRLGEAVRRGVKFLLVTPSGDGSYEAREEPVVDQALAALALAEAYGMTSAAVYRGPAQRAIAWIESARLPQGGWSTSPRSGSPDLLATTFSILAWKSAQVSGLQVGAPPTSASLTLASAPSTSRHPLSAAVALATRTLLEKRSRSNGPSPEVRLLLDDPPRWDPRENDPTYWYFATLALFHHQDESAWRTWDEVMQPTLRNHQHGRESRCALGSWPPVPDDAEPRRGGRVSSTALAALTLEIYARRR